MAAITVNAANAIGSTGSLAAGVSSAALYTVPASTSAKLMYSITLRTAGTGTPLELLINDIQIESLGAAQEEKDWSAKFIYMETGDTIKLRNGDGANALTADYYFSLVEQT